MGTICYIAATGSNPRTRPRALLNCRQQENKDSRCGNHKRAARSNRPSNHNRRIQRQMDSIPPSNRNTQAYIQLGDFNQFLIRQITRMIRLQIKDIQTYIFREQDVWEVHYISTIRLVAIPMDTNAHGHIIGQGRESDTTSGRHVFITTSSAASHQSSCTKRVPVKLINRLIRQLPKAKVKHSRN